MNVPGCFAFFNDLYGTMDDHVRIGEVRLGTVVRGTRFNDSGGKVLDNKYGHVVGFIRSDTGELILNVQWEDGTTRAIHPGNVQLAR